MPSVLNVSRAGFCQLKNRPLSSRAIREAWLTDLIAEIHASSRGTHGSPSSRRTTLLGGPHRCRAQPGQPAHANRWTSRSAIETQIQEPGPSRYGIRSGQPSVRDARTEIAPWCSTRSAEGKNV